MNMKLLNSFILVLILLITSCNKSDYRKEVLDNGIISHINRNIQKDISVFLSIEKINTINKKDENDKEYYSFDPVDFKIDSDGNRYILDYKTLKIIKYNSEGRFSCIFGGKGNGPGELMNSVSFDVLNDSIIVSNIPKRELVYFNRKGKFLKNRRIRDYLSYFHLLKNKNKCHFLASIPNNSREGNKLKLEKSLKIIDYDFTKDISIHSKSTVLGGNSPFNPYNYKIIYKSNKKDLLVVAENVDYELSIYDLKGKKTEIIKKYFHKIPVTKDYLEAIEKKFKLTNEDGELKTKIGIEYKNTIKKIFIDKSNRIWIMYENDDIDNKILDIFENGRYLGFVKLKYDFNNLYFENDKMIIYNTENEFVIFKYDLNLH